MSENKIPVVAVIGPTASGKTALSVRLAEVFHGEIVGADSMQIYKTMQIATAKPTLQEMRGIPHHLIGFLPPGEPFSVAQYVEHGKSAIADIHARGHLPILCGGTGLFVDSLLQNIQFVPQQTDEAYRGQLTARSHTEGGEHLLEQLRLVDPAGAAKLHPNNLGRIIRALEVYHVTGKTLTYWNAQSRIRPSPYEAVIIGIGFRDRGVLYDRIDRRVDEMMSAGLLEETKQVLRLGELPTAKQAIGYKELAPYLGGECSLEDAVERLKRETRRYAKRQLTWFRRNTQIHWLYADDYEDGDTMLLQAQRMVKEARKK